MRLLTRFSRALPAKVLAFVGLSVVGHAWSHDPDKVLKVAAPWEISSLDPAKAGYVFTRLEITETLVDVDVNGQLVAGLAHSWEVSKDQLTWRFQLRPSARFHDNTQVSAEAVVAALRRAQSQPGVLRNVPVKTILSSGTNVVIELNKPFSALPAFLAHTSTQILAPASYATDGSLRTVLGSGPYKIQQISPPQKLQTVRFAGYDGKPPSIVGVEYLASGRGETRGMLAESGQSDLVFTHDAAAFERLKKKSNVDFYSIAIPRTIYLKVNAAHPALSDLRVRRALSLAIDRQGIAGAILRQPQAAATQLFSPGMAEWHVAGLPPLEHNLEQSRRLLQEAGWQLDKAGMLVKEGKPFKVTLRTFSDRPELPPMATALQAQFKQIGIDMVVSVGNSSEIPSGHQDGTLELGLLARNYSLVPDPIGTLLQDFGQQGGDWGAMGWRSAQVIT